MLVAARAALPCLRSRCIYVVDTRVVTRHRAALVWRPGRVAVLADQVKSLDWAERKAKYKGGAKPVELPNVRAKITALVSG